MSSSQGNSNGNAPSIPVLSGIANGVGMGSPLSGAPTVTPPNQADFQVPNAAQIQQAIQTLHNSQISTDQTGLNQTIGQENQLAQGDMQQLQQGAGTGQSAAAIGSQAGLEQNQNQANASQQNSLGGAANSLGQLRTTQQTQASQNAQTVSAGAQARAGEENAIRQNAQNAISSAMQGTLAGASQRLSAAVATQNLQMQAIQQSTQLAQMQLQSSMNYAKMSQQYQVQQRQDYLHAQMQSIKNMQMLVGGLLQAAGTAGAYGAAQFGKMGAPSAESDDAGGGLSSGQDNANSDMNASSAQTQYADNSYNENPFLK